MKDRVLSLLRMRHPVLTDRGLLFGSGPDYPTIGADGWQTGAIWLNTTGAAGSSLYVNEGSVTSANFVPVDTAAGASAGAIAFDDNVTGPLISIETDTPTNDSYTTPFIITGAYSSSADNALVVTATNNRPVSFLFDDGGDVFVAPADIRAGLFRLLLTVNQTAAVTINALRAQIKANNTVGITNAGAVVAPLTGYLELDGVGARTLNGHVACVRAALETGAGDHTVSLNLCGFESTLNSSGTFVGGGYTAAFAANISSGTSLWQHGLKIEAASCLVGVTIGAVATGIAVGACTAGIVLTGVVARAIDIQTTGVFRMGIEGTGVPVDNTYPYGLEIHTKTIADFAQPATGVSAGIYSRYEHSFDQTTATGHAAVFAKFRVKKDLEDGVHAASYNLVEISGGANTVITGTATTQTTAGMFVIETDSGFELAAGLMSGIIVDSSIHVTGTFTGTISGVRIQKAGSAKAWPTGIAIVADATETGITIGACAGAALQVTGKWGAGYNTAGILIAADQAGAAVALGSSDSGWCIVRTNVTAAATTGSYIFGEYLTIATSAAMVDGFIMGKYVKVNLAHVAYENYAIRGRMCVDVAQTGGTGNQYLGVFGAVEFAAGAHALLATGGGYGVLGTASIASGGTLDQPLLGGYFECNAVDNIAGLTVASRHRMLGYCDYGVDVLVGTSNGIAGIRIAPEQSANLNVGISIEVAAGSGNVNHLFKLEDATACCVNTSGNVGGAQASDAIIKIDIAGTDYYLPAFVAGSVTGDWADN